MLGDRPGEKAILQLLGSRFALRHNLQRIACNAAIITALEQDSTRDALHLKSCPRRIRERSEEHTSELQSLMRISYAVFCLKKKNEYHILILSKHKSNKHHNRL